jgi:hypothetical protein
MSTVLGCPTCRVSWRGVATCPRCGTDLAPAMRVAVSAWELREAARLALCAGDPAAALDLARAAWRLHTTARGRRLLVLALLATGRTAEARPLLEQASAAAPVARDSLPDA